MSSDHDHAGISFGTAKSPAPAKDGRTCYSCRALARSGQRCGQCGWPDPVAQPKQHIAYLKREVTRIERAAKRAGVKKLDSIRVARQKLKAARR